LDVICLVSAPHAGTERLREVLEQFGDLAAFPNASAALEAGAPAKRVTCFPLFDGDLRADELLDRPGLRFMLVVRKQIDCYVELLGGAGEKPALDAEAFAEWLKAQERWYDRWRNALNRRGLPCPVLRYESDIDQPTARALQRFAAGAAQLGIVLKVPAAIDKPDAPAKAIAAMDRVGNWPAFSRALFAKGLERRAFGYPL
jgi:hypothetical protein